MTIVILTREQGRLSMDRKKKQKSSAGRPRALLITQVIRWSPQRAHGQCSKCTISSWPMYAAVCNGPWYKPLKIFGDPPATTRSLPMSPPTCIESYPQCFTSSSCTIRMLTNAEKLPLPVGLGLCYQASVCCCHARETFSSR